MFVSSSKIKPGRSRDALVNRLVALRDQWKRSSSYAESFAAFIQGCRYASVAKFEWKDFVPSTSTTSSTMSLTKCVTGTQSSQFPFVIAEPPEWDVNTERMFAEELVYRDYKKTQGWPSYYDSRETIKSFIVQSSSKTSPEAGEVIRLAQQLSLYASPSILLETEQGREFANTCRRCISSAIAQRWNTCDVLQRLFLIHHHSGKWEELFAHAWGSDLTVEREMNDYLVRYPCLSSEMIDSLF